jgi:hypothetical protein
MHDHHHHDRPPKHEPGPGTHELSPGDRTLLPKVHLEIEVRDENENLVERQQAAANLATDNWIEASRAMLAFNTGGSLEQASLTDDGGNSRSPTWYGDSGDGGDWFGNTRSENAGPKLAIGDGGGSSVSPQRANIDLDNRLDRKQAGAPSKGTDSVSVSATFTNSTGSQFTVRETGIFYAWNVGNGVTHDFLCWHDSVSATDVPDGNTVTVTYTFTWP